MTIMRPRTGKPICNSKRRGISPIKADPTRTATLRRQFAQALRQRFRQLALAVRKLMIEEDAFGLRPASHDPFTTNTRWRFATTPEKVKAFQSWLKQQFQDLHLTDDELWKKFVTDGFRRGAGRAFEDVRVARLRRERPELFTPEAQGALRDFYRGNKEEFLRAAFGRPETREKVELLAGRVFTDLKGITEPMAARISRELTDGLVRGANPREIAKDLEDAIGVGSQRAEMIARTEIVRAHAAGQLRAMEDMGIEEVGVAVEWSTAGDDRVCEVCAELEGVVLKLAEAEGLLPRHPNCRCALVPANVGEASVDQIASKRSIDAAIGRSIRAEGRDRDTTTWAGADASIAKARPQSILNNELSPVLLAFSRFLQESQ